MKSYFILLTHLGVLLYSTSLKAQADTSRIYHVRRAYELPASVAFLGASYFGFRELDKHASLTEADVLKLDPSQINRFDRPVAFYNPARFEQAQQRSDLFLNIAIASPALLALSKQVRHNALDLLILYTTTHAINNVVYFGVTYPIRRARPLTYNSGLPLEEKIGQAKSNSFFSGHVSFSSTATFFGAKVLTDYYHIKGWKRIGIYTLASVPPILVGVNRMQAGKHFRTDVITGFLIGAACGIVVPELHKRHNQPSSHASQLSWDAEFSPGSFSGIHLRYRL